MQNRDVIITDTQTERSSAPWGIIAAVIIIALAIALFVWQPWNSTTTQTNSNSTSVTQPNGANNANNANGQNGTSQTNPNSGNTGGGNSNP